MSSSIYRQLTHLSMPELSNYSHPNTVQFYQPQQKTSYEQLYVYKQQKHNQLMQRLKNSELQNQKLLETYAKANFSGNVYHNQGYNTYQSNHNIYQNNNQNTLKKSMYKYKMTKYRHIEDNLKEKEPEFQVNEICQNTLQRQFYGTNTQTIPQKQIIKYKDIGIQYQPIENQRNVKEIDLQKYSDKSKTSYGDNHGNHWLNKSSKYEDKIQNYYQLCRKTGRSLKSDPKRQNKFVRNDRNVKKSLELNQALKLLSS